MFEDYKWYYYFEELVRYNNKAVYFTGMRLFKLQPQDDIQFFKGYSIQHFWFETKDECNEFRDKYFETIDNLRQIHRHHSGIFYE